MINFFAFLDHAQSRVPNPSEKKEANKLVLFFVLFAKSVFCHHLVAIRCQSTFLNVCQQ